MQPLDYYSLSPMPPFMRSTKKKNQASQGLLLFKASSCGMVIKKVVTTEPILGYTALLYVEHHQKRPPFLCTEKKMNQTHHRKSLCKSFLGQNGSLIAHFCPYQTYKFLETRQIDVVKKQKKVRSSLRFVPFVFC